MANPLIKDVQLDSKTVDVANIRTQFLALIQDYRNKADMIELAVSMLDGTLAPKYAELDAANAQVVDLTQQVADITTQLQASQAENFTLLQENTNLTKGIQTPADQISSQQVTP